MSDAPFAFTIYFTLLFLLCFEIVYSCCIRRLSVPMPEIQESESVE